jgi:hypothetical protein
MLEALQGENCGPTNLESSSLKLPMTQCGPNCKGIRPTRSLSQPKGFQGNDSAFGLNAFESWNTLLLPRSNLHKSSCLQRQPPLHEPKELAASQFSRIVVPSRKLSQVPCTKVANHTFLKSVSTCCDAHFYLTLSQTIACNVWCLVCEHPGKGYGIEQLIIDSSKTNLTHCPQKAVADSKHLQLSFFDGT